jgi:hypothetical protein
MRSPLERPHFEQLDLEQKLPQEPNHTSLALIDRVSRTLRDMAFNMRVALIVPHVFESIISLYNQAPHNTLSKIMGFPVAPLMTMEDQVLKYEIRRRLTAQNQVIKSNKGFHLPLGSYVAVLNEHQKFYKRRRLVKSKIYEITGFNGILFRLRSVPFDGQEIYEPRYRIRPARTDEG